MTAKLHLLPDPKLKTNKKIADTPFLSGPGNEKRKVCRKCGGEIVSIADGGDVDTISFTENLAVWTDPPTGFIKCVL